MTTWSPSTKQLTIQVVTVDLPAPRLVDGRRAEDAQPVVPLAVLLRLPVISPITSFSRMTSRAS